MPNRHKTGGASGEITGEITGEMRRDQATCFSSFALSEATLSASAREMISSATMRPDLVAPSIESR